MASHPLDPNHLQAVLHDLVDMGHDIARQIHAEAMAHPRGETPKPDFTIPFERIARTVRRTILLAQRLAENAPARHEAARRHILRGVEDAIDAAVIRKRVPDPGALQAELHERLDAPDVLDDLGTRPIADIIAEICNDLGVGKRGLLGLTPVRRRTPADIAALCARAAPQPGRPRTSLVQDG